MHLWMGGDGGEEGETEEDIKVKDKETEKIMWGVLSKLVGNRTQKYQ